MPTLVTKVERARRIRIFAMSFLVEPWVGATDSNLLDLLGKRYSNTSGDVRALLGQRSTSRSTYRGQRSVAVRSHEGRRRALLRLLSLPYKHHPGGWLIEDLTPATYSPDDDPIVMFAAKHLFAAKMDRVVWASWVEYARTERDLLLRGAVLPIDAKPPMMPADTPPPEPEPTPEPTPEPEPEPEPTPEPEPEPEPEPPTLQESIRALLAAMSAEKVESLTINADGTVTVKRQKIRVEIVEETLTI